MNYFYKRSDDVKKSYIISGVFLLGVVSWGALYFLDPFTDDAKEDEVVLHEDNIATSLENDRENLKGTITNTDLKNFNESGLNPFGTSVSMEEMTDDHFQEFIHGMSHQKVEASKKWGFYELHPERVKWLLEALEVVDVSYEKVYKRILTKWDKQVFSEVDEDHNAIWSLQGGTVGKATGVLSPVEEQEYIESQS
jgi:hypothetical protein